MDSREADDVRQTLQARLDALHGRLTAMSRPPERGTEIGFGKRIGDGTLEAVSRLTDVGVGRNLETSGEEIVRALAKLDDGTYGICDVCAGPIAPRRLEVKPESVRCIACARL